jgi:hypothetical protein
MSEVELSNGAGGKVERSVDARGLCAVPVVRGWVEANEDYVAG